MAADAGKMEEASKENGSASNDILPSLEEQKRTIEELLKTPLTKGETWYLIDCKWLKQWKRYVGYDTWDHYGSGDQMYNPGPIDNSILFKDGKLKDHLIDELDYCLLPEPGWDKLLSWYGMLPTQEAVPRKVVEHGTFVRHCKVEVYLMELRLCQNSELERLVTKQFSKGDSLAAIVSIMKEIFEIPPEAETRLWNKYMSSTYELLSNMEQTVQDAGLYQGQVLVIEQKNEDGSWQRQTSSSSYSASKVASSSYSMYGSPASYGYGSSGSYWGHSDKNRRGYHTPGLTGLSNLGNTCFMNSALQCLSNTMPLTKYFLSGEYKHELNFDNPLGMRGEIAKHFASLLNELWDSGVSHVAPRSFKMQVGRFAPQFSGYQQQDSQEFLAFLLDGIHEDLNRVKKKPYIEVKDANGRPDEIVAKEAWNNHRQRNDSIIVDTFHGLFKSTLVCPDCSKVSVTFDPFCYLSLPLPFKKERFINVFLIRSDPMKKPMLYKVTVPKMGCIGDLVSALSKLANIASDKMVVSDVYNHRFHKVFNANEALTQILDRDDIFAYELTHCVSDEESVAVPVYQREKKTRFSYSTSNKVLFGLPLFVSVPKKSLTYSSLYNLLLDQMRRYVVVKGDDARMDCDGETKNNRENSSDEEINETANGGNDNGEPTSGDQRQSGKTAQARISGDDQDEGADARQKEDGKCNAARAERNKPRKPLSKVVKANKYIFSMSLVNSYGSADIQALHDSDKPLQLTDRCYLALDWNSKAKEAYYDDQIAEESEEHETVTRKIPPKKNMVSLSDCINEFLKKETLGANDLWYCPTCGKHQQATKKFDLWSLPKMLVVHLKRFSYSTSVRDKLDTLVDFPLRQLDMSQYVINKNQPQTLYNLVAVSNHYGGMGGGHYTAYATNCESDQWYSFDDSSVSTIDEGHLVSKAAYVLFYQRLDNDADKGPEEERMSETSEGAQSEEDMDIK